MRKLRPQILTITRSGLIIYSSLREAGLTDKQNQTRYIKYLTSINISQIAFTHALTSSGFPIRVIIYSRLKDRSRNERNVS